MSIGRRISTYGIKRICKVPLFGGQLDVKRERNEPLAGQFSCQIRQLYYSESWVDALKSSIEEILH